MNVLHTIQTLNKSYGGPSSCTYQLIKGLRSIGVNAEILTLMPKKSADKIIAFDSFVKALDNDSISPWIYSKNIKKFLEKNPYDIYHANGIWTFPSHFTINQSLKLSRPVLLAPHGMLYPEALKVSLWKKKITLNYFQQKDFERVSCLQATCFTEMEHLREFGLKNPIAIVPNCLEIDCNINIRETVNEVKRFGFIGRLNRIKNIDVLLQAWSKLGKTTNNAELIIIGEGDDSYKRELMSYVDSCALKNVFFAGFLTGNELKNMMYTLDYQILPSKSENFGMVVPEALMHGVPVITSTGTPWKVLVEQKCGWWVEPSIKNLASSIEEALLLSEEARKVMGMNGRSLVLDQYTSVKVAKQMNQVYLWLLGKAEKPNNVYIW